MEKLIISDKKCYLHCNEKPKFLIIQPCGEQEISSLDDEIKAIQGTEFAFCAL